MSSCTHGSALYVVTPPDAPRAGRYLLRLSMYAWHFVPNAHASLREIPCPLVEIVAARRLCRLRPLLLSSAKLLPFSAPGSGHSFAPASLLGALFFLRKTAPFLRPGSGHSFAPRRPRLCPRAVRSFLSTRKSPEKGACASSPGIVSVCGFCQTPRQLSSSPPAATVLMPSTRLSMLLTPQ